VIAEFHVGGDAKLNWYGVRHSITQQKLLHLYGLVAAELPEWFIGRFSGGSITENGPNNDIQRSFSSQARRVGQTKPDAKRQHISGWEDGRKRTGPASADPV
jgi:hypothetical protein